MQPCAVAILSTPAAILNCAKKQRLVRSTKCRCCTRHRHFFQMVSRSASVGHGFPSTSAAITSVSYVLSQMIPPSYRTTTLDHAPENPSANTVTHTRAPSSSAKHHRVCRRKQKQRALRRKQKHEKQVLQNALVSEPLVNHETCSCKGVSASHTPRCVSTCPTKEHLTKIDGVRGLYDIVTRADVNECGNEMGRDTLTDTHQTGAVEKGGGGACVIC